MNDSVSVGPEPRQESSVSTAQSETQNIIRIARRDRGFVVIANALLRDSRLSYKARGMAASLLTHKDDWEINVTQLVNASEKDGWHAVRSGLKELEQAGYLVKKGIRDESGRYVAHVYILHEEPLSGFPQVGFPQVGNRRQRKNIGKGELSTNNHQRVVVETSSLDVEEDPEQQIRSGLADAGIDAGAIEYALDAYRKAIAAGDRVNNPVGYCLSTAERFRADNPPPPPPRTVTYRPKEEGRDYRFDENGRVILQGVSA